MVELIVAMGLLVGAILPLAYSVAAERKLARALYSRAVAMEIVDGEIEVLLAGGWRACNPGTRPYEVRGRAVTNLPPGKFLVTLNSNVIRLEWRPETRQKGGAVVRQGRIP